MRCSRIFGDNRIEAGEMEIDGFSCSTVFGDTSLNLTGARLKSGQNNVDIHSVFGDITVIVPAGIEVKAFSSSTFGDHYVFGRTMSGLGKSLANQTDKYDSVDSKVHMSVRAVFGDINIHRA
jgi:lia operon protein LiaF